MSSPSVSATPYARTTRGSGPGILLAHGATGSVATNFGPLLEALAPTHALVGVDFPGSGDSPRSAAPLVLDDLADQLIAAGVDEGLKTFAVIGYSLGAAVAIRATVRHPGRITALVLTAPFARPNARLRLAAELARDLHAMNEPSLVARHMVPLALSAAALDSLPAANLPGVLQMNADTLVPGAGDQMDLVTRLDIRDDLPRIAVPTLVISTAVDRLVTADLHREVATAISGAELTDIVSGHLPFVENSSGWVTAVSDFLARCQ